MRALLLVLCVLPFVLSDYHTFELTMILIYAIALLGLNLLTGYSGQVSLGHGAFYAIGAYTAAILINSADVPYLVTVPAAGLVCLVSGFLFGLPALRLQGLYLALATFSLAVAVPQLLQLDALKPLTGGSQGISIVKPDAPFGLPLTSDQWLYFLTLAVTIAMFVLGVNLLRGRIGRALIAIRDQPTAATAVGVNLAMYKSGIFGVSAMYTGIAGALGAIAVQFVAPDSFTVFLSLGFLVGAVVGGIESVSGAVFGALFIEFVPNFAGQLSKAAPWALYGVITIVVMCAFPTGIAGAIRLALAKIEGMTSGRRVAASQTGGTHAGI